MMRIQYVQPARDLQPYIERYWSWESPAHRTYELPRLIPGTGAELIFHYGTPFSVHSPRHAPQLLPPAHLYCLRETAYGLTVTGVVGFIAIRFRAGALRHFCPIPMGEIINTTRTPEELWGTAGKMFAQRVLEAPDLQPRVAVLEAQLRHLGQRYHQADARLDYAVQRIYEDHHALRLDDVSRTLEITPRHLQRLFKALQGISPKYFHRLARFQKTLKHLLLAKETAYLPIALEHGYYDQAHFIKEFQTFVGEPPSVFLQEKNFRSHFYNTKLTG
jgi:AraC-like DNA-binding protein